MFASSCTADWFLEMHPVFIPAFLTVIAAMAMKLNNNDNSIENGKQNKNYAIKMQKFDKWDSAKWK